jgi:hypothetical protein
MRYFLAILSNTLFFYTVLTTLLRHQGHATMDVLFLLGLAIFFQCLSINTKKKAE